MTTENNGPKTDSSGFDRFAPGIAMLGSYQGSWFRPDFLAGLTVWAMLVPQALGYSSLARMPTVNGLYAAMGALLLYWLWGSSRELNVGPESTVAIMVATILVPRATAGSEGFVEMAAMLAILVGLVLLIGGIFRLGRIADLLSRPILAGYVFGSGILIIVSKLADPFGIDIDASLGAPGGALVCPKCGRFGCTRRRSVSMLFIRYRSILSDREEGPWVKLRFGDSWEPRR